MTTVRANTAGSAWAAFSRLTVRGRAGFASAILRSKARRRRGLRVYTIEERPAGAAGPGDDGALEVRAAESRSAAVVRAAGARAAAAKRAQMRVGMCATAFAAAFAMLGVRLWSVSTEEPRLAGAGSNAGAAYATAPEIVDRNDALLATWLPMRAVAVAGKEVWDPRETAARLASVLPGLNAEALADRLAARRFVVLPHAVTPRREAAVFALGLPGVSFIDRTKRYYPQGRLGSHVVGWREPGKGGVAGLERVLDGRAARAVPAPSTAAPMVASIDLNAQKALERTLGASVEKFAAEAGWGAVMDVHTGEVIALSNAPTFDANAPGDAPDFARRNRAVYDLYELGSAFKAFTAAAALDAGVAREEAVYDARRPLRVADRWIRDFHGENRVLTFSEVVQHSSNIGAAQMAADLGAARQRAALEALGLLSTLDIELFERRAPMGPRKWGPVEAATISYGHGVSVTPLHMLAAFCAVVNGGVYRTPTFLAADAPRPGARVFGEETSAAMRRVLRRVVTDGTATYADVPGYYPIGKTATADKPSAGGYRKDQRIASFVGAFPGPAPRYAVLISLDNPQPIVGTHGYATAGWNAAPAFASLTARLAPALQLMAMSGEEAARNFAGPTGEVGEDFYFAPDDGAPGDALGATAERPARPLETAGAEARENARRHAAADGTLAR